MNSGNSHQSFPSSWRRCALGELVKITAGSGVPAENPILPFVGMEHIESQTGRLISYGNPTDYSSSSYIVDSNLVLYGRLRPYLNKVFIPKERSYASREFIPIEPTQEIHQAFLLHLLRSSQFVEFAISLNTGDRPRVKWPQMESYSVALPPFEEQEKIVEILEEHLSRLDAATAALVKARELLITLRRSTLFSLLQMPVTTSSSDGHMTLAECAELTLGIMLDRAKSTGKHLTPYLGNINVRWNTFDLTELKTMDIKPGQVERSRARAGDVVVCEGGEPGRSAVWTSDSPISIQKALHRVRPKPEVSAHYLQLCFELEFRGVSNHPLFTGTTIKHLPKEKLGQLRIRVPRIEEQEVIVARCREIFDLLEEAHSCLERLSAKLERTRRSALQAAFSGELTREWREKQNG
jgi:type I restriction enzyme S subunit